MTTTSPRASAEAKPGVAPVPAFTALDGVMAPVLVARSDRIVWVNPEGAKLLGNGNRGRLLGRSLSGVLEARVVGEQAKKDLLLWLLGGKTLSEAVSEPLDFLCGEQRIGKISLVRRAVALDQESAAVITLLDASVASLPPAEVEAPSARTLSEGERLTSMAQLASTAAQAVNNPLAYIASNVTYSSERLKYISALLDESSAMQVSDPRTLRGLLLPVVEALGEAHVGAGRASRLIKELRSLMEQDSPFAPVDAGATLEAALDMAESEVSLRARLRADLGASGFVLGNTARVTQLFLCVIVSRAQSLDGGNPQRYRIDVSSRTEGEWFVVTVADNGQAVAELEGPASAEPTFGPPALDVRAETALCRQLAASLHGSFEVDEVPRTGTLVTVRLPLKDSSRRPHLASLEPVRPGRRTRVLIVDNEPLIVRALSRLLKGDHDVETAGGGFEALDLIRHAEPFDLVLCDLAMPEMNGIELFQETVRVAPDMAPRFVFVTGGAVAEGFHEVLDGLPNRILEKPIQPELLREVVGQLLGTREARPSR